MSLSPKVIPTYQYRSRHWLCQTVPFSNYPSSIPSSTLQWLHSTKPLRLTACIAIKEHPKPNTLSVAFQKLLKSPWTSGVERGCLEKLFCHVSGSEKFSTARLYFPSRLWIFLILIKRKYKSGQYNLCLLFQIIQVENDFLLQIILFNIGSWLEDSDLPQASKWPFMAEWKPGIKSTQSVSNLNPLDGMSLEKNDRFNACSCS